MSIFSFYFVYLQQVEKKESTKSKDDGPTGAPSVDFLNSTVSAEAPKSTIGVRKVQPRRGVCYLYFVI